MAAAERQLRTIEKLIIDAAMIQTVWATGEIFEGTMIAESRRQLRRILPIDTRKAIAGVFDFDSARRS
ncbi:MAG: hypothetical protein WAK55_26150 [Xanthobacteraceae bacterium]